MEMIIKSMPTRQKKKKMFLAMFLWIMIAGLSSWALAAEIMHPIMNPPQYTKGNCPNCGMMLNMWARTRHVFTLTEGRLEACSIRCMADLATKAGEQPQDVQVALYLKPEKMIPAHQAFYVVGSTAKGTMTMVSKIAFASKEEADQFAASSGGKVMDFTGALAMADKELDMSRANITANRKKMGKIKDPADSDHCLTCGMYPARFPAHRAQILTKDGATLHFCSTKCLINYLANPAEYAKNTPAAAAIWVTIYPDGDYDYAKGLYYVVGSKVMGPMGSEALPFRKKANAQALAEKEGGRVMRFGEIKPAMFD